MTKATCSIEGCPEPINCRGWCKSHYNRWHRYGDPLGLAQNPHGTLEERFWPKVNKRGPDECWEWLASRGPGGYGMIGSGGWHGRPLPAHRVAYELLVAPIPDGLVLDHLCRNRGCVNPAHLEPVTNVDNVLRGISPPAENARLEYCRHGHPLTPENIYTPPSGGRKCLECNRINCRAYKARRRERLAALAS